MSRFLRALLAVCLLALVPGCGADARDPLVVLGPWTGEEGKAFEATLDKLDDGTGRTYTYEGTRSLRETLVSQLEADDPPDVAVLNSIGELTEYARRDKLRPLVNESSERAFAPWAPTLIVDNKQRTYWVPLKVDLKSLVWSKRGAPGDRPTWCVGLASQATSGWPGTDWIEDLVLHQAGPTLYVQWATGLLDWRDPAVRNAWTTWARLLGKRSPDAVQRSLTTSFEGASTADGEPRGLLDSPRFGCTHEHQSAFIRYVYAGDDVKVEPSARYLGGKSAYRDAFEVAGDMAAVFSDDPDAQELVARLSSRAGRELWRAEAGPAVRPLFPDTAGLSLPGSATPVEREIESLLTSRARTLCFDASDVMAPELRDAFHRAVLEFFRDPTERQLDSLLDQLETIRIHTNTDSGTDRSFRPPSAICEPQGADDPESGRTQGAPPGG
ncbi:alpha-glucoside ABC transporter substrate-binding protein [Streptomyces griseorubiginosus]|uniref:alpha-glucoside ABC transporter substrate-binding protein n=1 Tax=Streptomyces griseorubiginosus TaxID=67304 RepID=UPI002E7FDABB|nr:alpha-glucoside ABC transporter substrate-binding protein [Streptomyces griseorubiginosus]WUB48991.1 alpha-glucoside ABC transporter substrate-binding protein [Streptomyces griseorubiginosus]WUB57518.1 alpha-glucoside ABC transporter substrate-binding protein [Streptomyces griseorubiginosus]